MPPHRVLQHQQVGLVHPRQFVGDHLGQHAGGRRMALLGVHVETGRRRAVGVEFRALAGIKANRVEIGHGDGPALGLESGGARANQMGIEGLRFRVRQNEVGVHLFSPLSGRHAATGTV